MSADEFFAYGPPAFTGTGWPSFAQAWLGGEFPAGRGLPADPQPGWCCPGCGRGYSPKVFQCYHCGPEPGAVTRDLTWSPDEPEPDDS